MRNFVLLICVCRSTFASISFSGICKENLSFGIWKNGNQIINNKHFPRLVRLIGSNSNSTIKDNSSNNDSLILVDGGSTLILDNLTLEGGLNGVYGTRNSNVLFNNVTINGFSNRGISITDSSCLGVDEGGVNILGNNAERGINLSTGSSGWIYNAVISNVKRGITVYGGSMTYIKNFDIVGGERGINVSASKLLKYDNDGTGLGTISETSDRAIGVYDSIFKNWDPGKLEIRNLTSGRGIDIDSSTVEIRHLEMIGLDSSDENVLELRNSNFNLRNINISNSGRNGINFFGSSGTKK